MEKEFKSALKFMQLVDKLRDNHSFSLDSFGVGSLEDDLHYATFSVKNSTRYFEIQVDSKGYIDLEVKERVHPNDKSIAWFKVDKDDTLMDLIQWKIQFQL